MAINTTEPNAIEFARRLRQLANIADCTALFREAVLPFGFDTFACGAFDSRDRDLSVFYIIDWPESWTRFYMESGFIERDPLLDELGKTNQPFTWNEPRIGRRLSKAGTEAINRCAERGWTEGMVVPVVGGSRRTGLVSMVGHREVMAAERDYLALVATALYHHVRGLAPRGGFAIPPAGLTDREITAIRHVAAGLADGAIATEMGVAKTTAHEFVEKARAKLKAGNRAELIAIAISLAIVEL